MEYELFNNEYTDDDYAYEDTNNENLVFEGDEGEGEGEGRRCGICMDVVVERGVLDCCQHWFCFSCIDNWASITNLCPLCQNEFQLITCIPVYDTIGGVQPDDGSYPREDGNEDWSVEGNNNTLSFPSYYIDENAVSCLEGNGCKIRSQSANLEDDPDIDTSIACDSCDLWYHAICVAFDADGNCENSWLCPRCLLDETSEKSELGPSNLHGSESSSYGHSVDGTFPMNVSVSVADAGETAVVVSNIDENQTTKVPCENRLFSVNTIKDSKIGNQDNEETNQLKLQGAEVFEDMWIDETFGDDNCKFKEHLAEEVFLRPKIEAVELDSSLLQVKTSELVSESPLPSGSSRNTKEETSVSNKLRTSELYDENGTLESGVHVTASADPSSDKTETTGELKEKKVSKACRLPAHKNPDKKDKADGITGAKRKQRDFSAKEQETKTKKQNSVSSKIVNTERRNRVAHSINEPKEPVVRNSKNSNNSIVKKRKVTADIRDIVQGARHRPKRLAPEETASGLRIKKILRRTTDDTESLVQVQSLRKEIRDAIRNRSSKEAGDNLFDPKLLAAFRTALAVQSTETKRPPPLDVKAKKALLQKGTVRENLMKKIYGIGGKRKRAWTRDCEIEFWKHRCSKVSKPEKIETLKSVLDLLRKGPEVMEIKKENTVEARSSILSRFYAADASVLPRNASIKPLSVHPTDSLVDSKEPKVTISSNAGEPSTRKVNTNKSLDQSSRFTGGSLMNAQKELGNGSDVKVDKKKWALEILARKTAVLGNNSSQGQDNAVLKGNYPLLAKLPVEMRPSLAPSRHNKISTSVRQAQLYRLTEHFLKKTNMPVTRPSAEIELAVADAINVEKSVADRSNSKLVYVNLCSQELLHRSDNIDSSASPDTEPKPGPETAKFDDIPTTTDVHIDVDEALRNAGLLSDSPPDSPQPYETDDAKEDDGPDNVFEIDCQPELDIYGDFEYDLEDDDVIGTNPIKTTTPQNDDTKIKMVFSTLDFDRSESAWSLEDREAPIVVENAKEDNTKEKNSLLEGAEDEYIGEYDELYGPDKEPLIEKYPEIKLPDLITENNVAELNGDQVSNLAENACALPNGNCSENLSDLPSKPLDMVEKKEKNSHADKKQQSHKRSSVFKKVEAYIKEHVRPLCKSGVITVEQYRWAVGKTTEKIMRYHSKDTNANFLIKEGDKVKKLAEQYVETAQKTENKK